MDIRRLVIAGRGERNATEPAELGELAEAQHLVAAGPGDAHGAIGEFDVGVGHAEVLGGKGHHAPTNRVRRVPGCPAVEVRARRGRGRRGVGHLGGRGGGRPDALDIDLEHLGHHLGHLDEQPLPHLRAAMVQADRAVGVDMHQRAGLVHVRQVEGDAELQRKQAQPALQHRVGRVEGVDLGTPPLDLAAGLHFGPAALQMVLVDLLAVRRFVPALCIEVERAHLDRIAAEMMRDPVERVLHHHDALRSAEAAKRRVRLLVGAAGIADGPEVRDPVGVVRMGERPRHHTGRHVETPAGIGRQHGVERQHAALAVEAHRVAIVEAVALAGRQHVDLARQPQLHRPAGLVRRDGGRGRDPGGVAFLAAEAAAQAAHHHRHPVEVAAQQPGADMLDLGRMLGRGMDGDVAVLTGQREGDLALEVKMLLSADAEFGGEPMRRAGQRRLRIAAYDRGRRLHVGFAGERRRDIEDRLLGLDLHDDLFGGRPRCIEGLRDDHRQGLAGELDPVDGEQRLVLADRRDVVAAGNVLGAQHRDHARHCRRGGEIGLHESSAGDLAQHQGRMQRARRLGHVVDIERLPGDVLQRAVVTLRRMDLAAHSASTSSTRPGSARRSSSRRSRLAATCRR